MADENALELQVFLPPDEVISPERSSGEAENLSSRQSDSCNVQDNDDAGERFSWYIPYKDVNREASLLKQIEEEEYAQVQGRVTAKTLMTFSDNPLLLAVKVAEKLHQRADENAPDKYDFRNLASRVEEFTLRLLDALNDDTESRKMFFNNPETDVLVETAIKLEQKKVFDHPVIIDLLADRWCGGYDRYRKLSRSWWFFLSVWCLFDVVLFPLTFLLTFVIGLHIEYKTYFKIPYFIFVRDTISYLVLVSLHLALCVESSKLSFSGLEWAILFFFAGRLLMEVKQIIDNARKPTERNLTGFSLFKANLNALKFDYIRDRWNAFDLLILVVYIFAILPSRIVTWVESESVNNNQILAIAGYLYGFNTMFLTFRAFGSILETIKGIGTIQIAFFHIIGDAVAVVLHFVVITLAFSSTITKVFVAEKTMVSGDASGKTTVCDKSGIQCWRKIATHLGWSLLDLSEGLSPLESTDSYSEALGQLLFGAYLVFALIILINMLIALLSNTYQRVQDNSRNEWVFKKAIAIQTYQNYHPIPVPLNIFTIPVVWIYNLCKRKAEETSQLDRNLEQVESLLQKYRLKYGDSFPPTNQIDQLLDDAESTESMVNQILYRIFTYQKGHDKALLPTGPKAWQTHKLILVEDYHITCLPHVFNVLGSGARYKVAFSHRFPHFEVMILESGVTKCIGFGVVFEDFDIRFHPGFEGTVGYHTDSNKIYDSSSDSGRKTTGSTAARRGDVIRCTVVFENAQEIEGKIQVPVVYSVNGRRIVPEDKKPSLIEYSDDRPLFPFVGFDKENSVLAKMSSREDVDYQGQEIKSRLEEVESKLECFDKKLNVISQCCEKNLISMDALLAKLGAEENKP